MDETTENRSVIKSGNSLSISLPAQWCFKNNITKGSMVSIDVNENRLYIHPLETQQSQETAYEESSITESIRENVTPKNKQCDGIDVNSLIRGYLQKK